MKKISKETVIIVCVALVFYIAGVLEVKYQDSKDTITVEELVSDYVMEEYGDYDYLEVKGIETGSDYYGYWTIDYDAEIIESDGHKHLISSTSSVNYMMLETDNKDKKITFLCRD